MLSMKVPGAGAPKMGISGDKWIVRKCWDNDRFNRGITRVLNCMDDVSCD